MKNNTNKGDTPMRANSALVIEPAQSWKRLQGAKEFFIENLDEFLHAQHKAVLEELMLYERECFLNGIRISVMRGAWIRPMAFMEGVWARGPAPLL
jgi:hypothetical protein